MVGGHSHHTLCGNQRREIACTKPAPMLPTLPRCNGRIEAAIVSSLSPCFLQRGKMKGKVRARLRRFCDHFRKRESKKMFCDLKKTWTLIRCTLRGRRSTFRRGILAPPGHCLTHRSSSTDCQPVQIPIPPRTHSYSQDLLHRFSSTNTNWIVSAKWAPRQSRATPAKPDKIVSSNGWGPP